LLAESSRVAAATKLGRRSEKLKPEKLNRNEVKIGRFSDQLIPERSGDGREANTETLKRG